MTKRPIDRQRAEQAGRVAEGVALAYLFCTGHRLLARRYKAASGEIDLVVKRGRLIIFCEVKFRQQTGHDDMPSPRQRRRICRAAQEFIARRHISREFDCRFDLIRISPLSWRGGLPLRHIRDAWWCDPA